MDLREYLFRKRLTQVEFAEKIGYTRDYVSQVVNGKKIPGKKMAKRVEVETKGAVKVKDLIKSKKRKDKQKNLLE